jgi:hypothetical protein
MGNESGINGDKHCQMEVKNVPNHLQNTGIFLLPKGNIIQNIPFDLSMSNTITKSLHDTPYINKKTRSNRDWNGFTRRKMRVSICRYQI